MWALTSAAGVRFTGELSGMPLKSGARVGPYVVGRVLGRGGMGQVYLARDMMLGRLVALKVLRPDRVRAERVARFEQESRVTAQFSHPHIVQVYGFGYSTAGPWLALEYLDGETLADRFRAGSIGPRAVVRLVHQVADALTAAHAGGVLHRDLKPANIMLPTDGRLRVVDFGLATLLEDLGGDPGEGAPKLAGTPAYMAPEQWRLGPVAAPADVWAFGVILHEGLYGRRPYAAAEADLDGLRRAVLSRERAPVAGELQGVSPELRALAVDCLEKEPGARPTAEAVASRLQHLLNPALSLESEDPPFVGLRAFGEENAPLFFGRRAEIDRATEQLTIGGGLVVVGPSGSGKSSLVFAGIIPRLREAGRWTVLPLRPGARPFAALAQLLARLPSALRVGVESGEEPTRAQLSAETVRREPLRALIGLLEIARETRGRVLLVIDQAEELLANEVDASVRRAFLELIGGLASVPHEPVRVIATLRGDFLGRFAQDAPSGGLFGRLLALNAPGPQHVRDAIEGPLRLHGYSVDDPALVGDMVDAMEGDVGALPVLQFVCARLWEARDREGRVVRRADYERLGGVEGAIARHADATIEAMGSEEREALRPLVLRLITRDRTRRTVSRASLLDSLGSEGEQVIDRLVSARLVIARRPADDRPEEGPRYELAHESLITRWGLLQRWLHEASDDLASLRDTEEAARAWVRSGEPADGLWRGRLVEDALAAVERTGAPLDEDTRTFLATAQQSEQSRSRRRRLAIYGGIAALALIAVGSAIAAAAFARAEAEVRAEKERGLAQAEQMRLAAADIGVFELSLGVFEWDPTAWTATDGEVSRIVAWELYEPKSTDPNEPAQAIPDSRLVWRTLGPGRYRVETRSGPAFLRVERRDRAGRRCSDSWVRLRWLPGYAGRSTGSAASTAEVSLRIPSCEASQAGTVLIEGGEFVRQGHGDPRSRFPEYFDAEERRQLPAYRMDRTEVSNAQYAVYGAMAHQTGRPSPRFPTTGLLERSGGPNYPVANLDWWEARDYCRFMGKRLPTSEEWEKAARGGVEVRGRPNPQPRRNLPWVGGDECVTCANLDGLDDGVGGTAPVTAFASGDSPYGLRQLSGNVSEWTRTRPPGEPAFRIHRGGSYADPRAEQMHWIAYENRRDARFVAFDIGLRCVLPGGE